MIELKADDAQAKAKAAEKAWLTIAADSAWIKVPEGKRAAAWSVWDQKVGAAWARMDKLRVKR